MFPFHVQFAVKNQREALVQKMYRHANGCPKDKKEKETAKALM
jgi:hypothetical protein